MSKKVLIVEDDEIWQSDWSHVLDGKVLVLKAFSIKEAHDVFVANTDLDAIVMDACVPGDSPTTLPLVEMIRGTFTGPMIAASSVGGYRRLLMKAGCDHESLKDHVPSKVLEVLGIT